MRKLISYLVVFMLLVAFPAYASVGIKVGNTEQGNATTLKFPSTIGTAMTNDGGVWTFNLLPVGIGASGATSMTTADLVVPVAYGYIKKAIVDTDPAFIAGTLADGRPGQLLTIHITETSGTSVFTVTPATSSQIQKVDFDAVGEFITLLWTDSTNGWVQYGYSNATVTGIAY